MYFFFVYSIVHQVEIILHLSPTSLTIWVSSMSIAETVWDELHDKVEYLGL